MTNLASFPKHDDRLTIRCVIFEMSTNYTFKLQKSNYAVQDKSLHTLKFIMTKKPALRFNNNLLIYRMST